MADQWFELVDAPSYQVWADTRVTATEEIDPADVFGLYPSGAPKPALRTLIKNKNHHLVVVDAAGQRDMIPIPYGPSIVFHGSPPPGEPWHTPREVFALFAVHRPPKVGEWRPCETPDLVTGT